MKRKVAWNSGIRGNFQTYCRARGLFCCQPGILPGREGGYRNPAHSRAASGLRDRSAAIPPGIPK